VELAIRAGINTFRIEFQHLRLLPGRYFLAMGILSDRGYEDAIDEAVQFEITPSPEAAEIDAQNFTGALVPNAVISMLN
jgi:hypothetical protein